MDVGRSGSVSVSDGRPFGVIVAATLTSAWQHYLRQSQASASWELHQQVWLTAQISPRPFLDAFEAQVEQQAVLALVAAAEAHILQSCAVWCTAPKSNREFVLTKVYLDAASQASAGKRQGVWPDLGHVLKILRDFGSDIEQQAVDSFRDLHRYRHWLAHGQQWDMPATLDSASAWSSIYTFLEALGMPLPEQPSGWV